MIRLAVLYPNKPGSRFDVDYYRVKHLGLARELLGSALKSIELDVGIAGSSGAAPFHAIGYLTFESMESFQNGLAVAAAQLSADVPNYTDVEGEVQISSHEKL